RLYGGIERVVDVLSRGLCELGHDVTLFAHRDSTARGRLIPLPGVTSSSRLDTMRNMGAILNEARSRDFDVIHSFRRLADLLPLMASNVPKLMTYQREVTPRSVRLGTLMSRGTLAFSAISESMLSNVKALARWHVVPNCAPASKYQYKPSVE